MTTPKKRKTNHPARQQADVKKHVMRQAFRALKQGDTITFLMMAFRAYRKTVTLNMPSDAPNILMKCKDIHDKMTVNSAVFDDPTPSMADFATHIATAFTKEGAMEDPDSEKTEERDEALSVILTDAFSLRDYVQLKVNADLVNAESMVLLAGMEIKKIGKRGKQTWGVKYTENSCEVELSGTTRKTRAAYDWQMTPTPDELPSWRIREIVPTLQANTIVSGLKLNDVMWFRYRTILKDGPTEWSNPIRVIII